MQTLNSNLLDESFSNFASVKEASVKELTKNISCETFNKDIGDGFFYKVCKDGSVNLGKNNGFFKKYIDGTIQQGKKINDDGKIVVKYNEEDVGGGAMKSTPIYDFPPKGKGIIKGDDKGDYYYFEELPEFRKQQIQKLENQKKQEQDRIDAQKRQKELENQKTQEKNRIDAQKRQEQSRKSEELKQKEEDKRLQEDKINKDLQKKQESKNKIKTYSIVAVSILALGIVYFKFIKK